MNEREKSFQVIAATSKVAGYFFVGLALTGFTLENYRQGGKSWQGVLLGVGLLAISAAVASQQRNPSPLGAGIDKSNSTPSNGN